MFVCHFNRTRSAKHCLSNSIYIHETVQLVHITLPGYFLFSWRSTALSLDSVPALQISWDLSSWSTSLRVHWKFKSDSFHLVSMRCFFSMLSREFSVLQRQYMNIIKTPFTHSIKDQQHMETGNLLCFIPHVCLTSPRSVYYKKNIRTFGGCQP